MNIDRRTFLKAISASAATMVAPLSALATPRPTEQPNILFFFPDQHRFDWTEMNKALPVRTPNLKQLAERGVHFTNAVCPSPLCSPSRGALASGKEYDNCGVAGNGNNYPIEQTTFYSVLRDAGYHVMGCGKFDLRKPAMSWGADGQHRVDGKCYLELWGFSDGIDNSGKHDGIRAYNKGILCPYFHHLESSSQAKVHVADFKARQQYKSVFPTPLTEEAYADNYIAQNGLNLLKKVPKDKPWFLQINFNGPHEPMDITKRMKDRWTGVDFPQPNASKEFTPETHVQIRQNYSAMIENIDRWLGIYTAELRKRGELENTLIVWASDHGEMLGDHEKWAKSVPYQPSVGVPMVVAGPRVKGERTCAAPATTLDLPATFIDIAGATVPPQMDSRSFLPYLEDKPFEHRPHVLSGLGKWRMVFDGRYKLIQNYGGEKKNANQKNTPQKTSKEYLLFDLKNDPGENINLADTSPEIVKKLAKQMPG